MKQPINNRIIAEYKLPPDFIDHYIKVSPDYMFEHMNRQLMQRLTEELLTHKHEAIETIISPSPIGTGTTLRAELFVFTRKELDAFIEECNRTIDFAKWISCYYSFGSIAGLWYFHENTSKQYTEEELYELYLEQLTQEYFSK